MTLIKTEGPGDWQTFPWREDNRGLTTEQLRKKYLQESLEFESFVAFQLNQSQGGPINSEYITDANLSQVIALWFTDQSAAEDKYGLIGAWDVSRVTDFEDAFEAGGVILNTFNENLDLWDMGNAETIEEMFYGQILFNQPLNSWNLSKCTRMNQVFQNATSFNQPLNNWDTSKVVTFQSIFESATAFNQDISAWDVGVATNFENMFYGASAFNQDISSWNMSSAIVLAGMFRNADAFNVDLSAWGNKVSNVTNMSSMFRECLIYNQDVSPWNTLAVTNMSNMFDSAAAFNNGGVALDWATVTSVDSMNSMFGGATIFNQDISAWVPTALTTASDFLTDNTGFSTANLDLVYTTWSTIASLQSEVTISFGTTQFSAGAATTGKADLTGGTNLWVISDGGQV